MDDEEVVDTDPAAGRLAIRDEEAVEDEAAEVEGLLLEMVLTGGRI